MGRLGDQIAGLFDHIEGHVGRAGDVDDDAGSAVDRGFKQRAGDGLLGGFRRAVRAAAAADTHMGAARVLHDALDVGEVEVDIAGHLDGVGNALDALPQHFVRFAERVAHGEGFVAEQFQSFVGNDDQRVDMLDQLADTVFGLLHPFSAFKFERLCHNTDGQRAEFAGDFRHNRRSAGAGAAAHTGGDKDHIGGAQGFGDDVAAFFRGFFADNRIAAGAHHAGDLFADQDLMGRFGVFQNLAVRVDGKKFHAEHTGIDHRVNRVSAAAADADHLDLVISNVFVVHDEAHFTSSYIIHTLENQGKRSYCRKADRIFKLL